MDDTPNEELVAEFERKIIRNLSLIGLAIVVIAILCIG